MNPLKQLTTEQFRKISVHYDVVQSNVISAIHRYSQKHYYSRCAGARILDIGNGGHSPEEILGYEPAGDAKLFVGIDSCIEMLKRKYSHYAQVCGDGFRLPFKDDSFDYVILSQILHHLGFRSKEDHFKRFETFVREALRVCSRELMVCEIVAPRYVAFLERAASSIFACMPTFALSEKTMDMYMEKMKLSRREITSRSLRELTHPFCWHPPIMNYQWLRFPAFLFPLKICFFVIPKSKNYKEAGLIGSISA